MVILGKTFVSIPYTVDMRCDLPEHNPLEMGLHGASKKSSTIPSGTLMGSSLANNVSRHFIILCLDSLHAPIVTIVAD